jgi:hypothetical protein
MLVGMMGAMESQVMRVGDLDVHVRVSGRRRTVQLTVERDATITASVPTEADTSQLTRIIVAKRPWLYAKLRERAEIGRPAPPREFVSGEGFLYLGRSYRLLLVDEGLRPVRLWRGRLELRRDSVDDATRHLITWYRSAGKQWLSQRIAPWAQRMSADVSALRVRSLGYRWGSCSPDGALNFHWAIMQLPSDLIDYVLVHELSHASHHDHGPEFWRAVERAMPDAPKRRARLRLAGPGLWLPEHSVPTPR